jgi:hypothetical protein
MKAIGFSWFQVIQTVFIVAGFFLAAVSLWRNTRALQVSNYMNLVKYNREIWQLAMKNENLQEVLSPHDALWTKKTSFEQKQFLKFVFLHLSSSYHLLKTGNVIESEGLSDDIKEFLQLPMPARFWQENKRFYNSDFVSFVETHAGPPAMPDSNKVQSASSAN